jgi:phosphatidylserine decarboxylase
MTIHKEGYKTLGIVAVSLFIINLFFHIITGSLIFSIVIGIISFAVFLFILRFFRNPNRKGITDEKCVISPADGTVVVIEKTEESEFLKSPRMQVSVFMSAWNVHINWLPIAGTVKYFKYHPGLFLLARNPKSSLENERTTIVVERADGIQILFRQIAGFVARRVVARVEVGQKAEQSAEFGFIKFGSRVDIFLPLNSKILVSIGDKVVGAQTKIAEF